MARDGASPLKTLDLGGDGDAIPALADVEREFGVRLDYSDARNWRTAGDLFGALKQELPSETHNGDDVWGRFTAAISLKNGLDPSRVTASTLLIGKPLPYGRLWLIGAIVGVTAAAYKVLLH